MKTSSARPDPSLYIPPPGLGYSRVQKLFAEFFGTFALVLFSVRSDLRRSVPAQYQR